MWKYEVKKLPYPLKPVHDCYNNHKMHKKAVGNYPHAVEFVPECYKTQNIVVELFINILLQLNKYLIAIRLKNV